MRLKRIIVERDFGSMRRHAGNYLLDRALDVLDYLRGWTERDIEALEEALNNPGFYDGGIVRLTRRQFTALEERNRRVAESKRALKVSPLLVWVKGRGLFAAIKKD